MSNKMKVDLSGKTAIVTGAGGVIGKAISLALAANGAKVVLTGRSRGPLEIVENEIKAAGGECTIIQSDISDKAKMDESTELMLTMMGAFAQAESESISGNIQAGKRYAMQRGEATINYYNLYAYEKGPDGNPQIIPEQAEIVREIYQKYLHGDSLNMIRKDLEERHIDH